MKAVVLACGDGTGLRPLTESTNASLLPVADKPLLVHALEALALANLKHAFLIVSSFAEDVKRTLGDGTQWGMRFEYLSTGPDNSPHDVLARLHEELNEDYLLVRTQMLRTPMVAQFLTRTASFHSDEIMATIGGVSAGISVVRRGARLWSRRTKLSDGDQWCERTRRVDFGEERLLLINSPAALHRANLDAIAGRFPGLILPGRELRARLRVGRKSRLPSAAIKGVPLFVGSRCRVAGNAELMSETVVSSDSVIDRRATLRRALVMPRTYVGPLLEVSNAIVAGDLLIDVDTGTHTKVTESFMLSSIDNRPLVGVIRDAAARVGGMLRVAFSPR
jgi:mannose-1-phosphate guanylyltransferase / phosphomannomutase